MQPTLFRYIWQGSKKGQLIVFLLTMLALPFYYVSLELPKLVINGVLGAQPGDFPIVVSAFDRALFDFDRVGWLLVLCIAFLLAVAAQGGVKFVLNVYKGRLGGEQLLQLRRQICSRVLQLPPDSFERMSSDEISTMIGSELTEVGGFIGEAFATPLLQGGLLITAIVFIFVQDGWLGLAAIALFPIQGYAIPRLQRRVNALTRDRVVAMRALAARLREATDALPEIQAAGGREAELNAIERRLLRIYDIRYAIFWRKSFIKLLNSFLFQLTPFLFLLIGGYFVLHGSLTLGALVAVLAAYKDLPPPARELLDYYQSLQNVRVQYEQVVNQFEAPDMEERGYDDRAAEPRTQHRSGIEVDALELSTGASVLLENVSFSIAPGESTAVLGLTQTEGEALARAVVGLDRPAHGYVHIGGLDATSLTSADRQGIMLISGHGALFNGTLRENIRYGLRDSDVCSERELESLAVVRLSDDLPYLGLNTVLDPAARELAADQLLRARHKVRTRLDSEGLVEAFDAKAFCRHTSIAENIVWGRPLGPEVKLDDLGEQPAARKAIKHARLEQALLDLGIEIGRALIAAESHRRSGDAFLDELVFSDERVSVHTALLQSDSRNPTRASGSARRLLLSIAMRVVPARHSRLHVSDELAEGVLEARRCFANALTAATRSRIEFFDPGRYMQSLTVRENLVFGVVKGARSQSVARLESMLLELIEEFELGDIVTRAGLEYPVGLHGHRLTPAQRQKLELARVVMRSPDLAVVHGATNHMDRQAEAEIVSGLIRAQRGRGLIWILDLPSLARHFDATLLFERGRLVASGPYADLDHAGVPLRALSLPE